MPPPKCTHPDPELCKALNRHIHGHLWDIWNCKGDYADRCESYRERWRRDSAKIRRRREWRGWKYFRFLRSVLHSLVRGLPIATQRDRTQRQFICSLCPHQTEDGRCGKCGCGVSRERRLILNKTAYALEQCPDDPPRWLPVKGQTVFAWLWHWLLSRFAKPIPIPPCDCLEEAPPEG